MVLYNSIPLVFFISLCIHALTFHSIIRLCLALPGNETDRLALLEVKARITNDPFQVLASWNETNHFCGWHGVTCGRRHQRVTMLDLNSLKLSGSISPHVGNLSFLTAIRLHNNALSQKIPPEISRLPRLRDLALENNSLSGEIPSNLSACSQLCRIYVAGNFLSGKIPKEVGKLSKLRIISIHKNNLTGSVPYSFANLSSLEIVSAGGNNLTGTIPNIFGQLTNLTFLAFSENSLSGVIPASVFNLSSIKTFNVVLNNIQGTLPSNFGPAIQSLENFHVSYNQLSGPIPVSISNVSSLVRLGLSVNQLRGNVPSLKKLHRLEWLVFAVNHIGSGGIGDLNFLCDLTNASNFQVLDIQANNFGGTLPHCIANLSSFNQFLATQNKILGSVPDGIGNLVNLERLVLPNNLLSGHIPPGLGKLQKLYYLEMSGNSLFGNIPPSFGNLSRLTELYLDGNKLQGNIPSSLAECHSLIILTLADNNFSGIISKEIIGLSSAYIRLDLSQNHFTGSLPMSAGNLINLEYLNTSRNMLSGEIPQSLGSCVKLEYLDMHGNFFQGNIPSSLGSLRGLSELYLSHNNLSGVIPEFLGNLEFMRSLDLSYNNLEGAVPAEGIFTNATSTSVEGNSKLCGGIPEFHLPKCKLQLSKKGGGLSLVFRLIISLICGLLGVSFALLFLYFYYSRRRRERKEHTASDSENFLKVSYRSLLKATDGFSSAHLIGMGSFGSVYKGVLEPGETTIAVKVFNLVNPKASKSFTAECEALKNIRHRNLVKVLSACSGVDYLGHDFKALIYEFMVNGSLEEWLHPTQTTGETNEMPRSLNFSQRLNIAIDVAMALDYLHRHCETPIVHCDLKPSNVLLNDDMIGHVGDFGLVRFLPKTTDRNQSSSIGLKGTIGYTPPEYGMGHEVWTQGDVYSYGILLLEMFTGKRPTDKMFQGTSNLHNLVQGCLPEQVVEIVDPVLIQEQVEGEEISANNRHDEATTQLRIKIEESLVSVLEIGVTCSAELPRERSDIGDAMAKMCKIRETLQAN